MTAFARARSMTIASIIFLNIGRFVDQDLSTVAL